MPVGFKSFSSCLLRTCSLDTIEIGQDKAQAIIDEITKAYEKSAAGEFLREYGIKEYTNATNFILRDI